MVPLSKHVLFYIAILLDIWERSVLRWQRREIVSRGDVAVGYRGIFGGLFGVVPVSTGHVVAFKDVYVKASVLELAVGDETPERNRALSAPPAMRRRTKTYPTPAPIIATLRMGRLN